MKVQNINNVQFNSMKSIKNIKKTGFRDELVGFAVVTPVVISSLIVYLDYFRNYSDQVKNTQEIKALNDTTFNSNSLKNLEKDTISFSEAQKAYFEAGQNITIKK